MFTLLLIIIAVYLMATTLIGTMKVTDIKGTREQHEELIAALKADNAELKAMLRGKQ